MARLSLISALVLFLLLAARSAPAQGVRPSEALLPDTTKGYFALDHYPTGRKAFEATQWGKLINDPQMRPFVDDLQRQLREKIMQDNGRLGLTWDDVQDIATGELCLAIIQPEKPVETKAVKPKPGVAPPAQPAVVPTPNWAQAWIVDVTGNLAAAKAALDKDERSLLQGGAKKTVRAVGGVNMTVYVRQKGKGQAPETVVHCLHQNQLITVNHEKIGEQIVSRLKGDQPGSLAQVVAFSTAMSKCKEELKNVAPVVEAKLTKPHLRWFVEPFGFTEALRAARGKKPPKQDLLKTLKKEKFTAIQGIGGYVYFLASPQDDIVHHEWIHAPGPFELSARILNLPNGGNLASPNWVPDDAANLAVYNNPLKESFEFSSTLIDTWVDEKGFFVDLLDSLKSDPDGPKLDVRNELIKYLGERGLAMTDNVEPIGPRSERRLFAFVVTDEAAVAKALEKAYKNDKAARAIPVGKHVVWEVEQDDDEPTGRPRAGQPKPKTTPLKPNQPKPKPAPAKPKPADLPKAGVTVAYGHLIRASNVSLVLHLLDKAAKNQGLPPMPDYQAVEQALVRLGAGQDCAHYFARIDKTSQVNWEMFRINKLPTADTILSRMLNRMLGDDEEDEDGKKKTRQQEFDGRKLPPHAVGVPYLHPHGFWLRHQGNGWYLVGTVLPK